MGPNNEIWNDGDKKEDRFYFFMDIPLTSQAHGARRAFEGNGLHCSHTHAAHVGIHSSSRHRTGLRDQPMPYPCFPQLPDKTCAFKARPLEIDFNSVLDSLRIIYPPFSIDLKREFRMNIPQLRKGSVAFLRRRRQKSIRACR
jgi:hypothetical protein